MVVSYSTLTYSFKMPFLAFERHRSRKLMSNSIFKSLRSSDYQMPHWPWLGSQVPNREHVRGNRGKIMNVSSALIDGYLNSEWPVHCRRTLDQYSYHMLDTTKTRDLDQVVYKWTKAEQKRRRDKQDSGQRPGSNGSDYETLYNRHFKVSLKAKDRPIVMVDQLWLWILPDGAPETPNITRNITDRQ